jgi:hypothetical protein
MKLLRIKPGHYTSVDGQVEIKREVSQQTYRAKEVVWSVAVDGHWLPMSESTKRDAARSAERYINESRCRR